MSNSSRSLGFVVINVTLSDEPEPGSVEQVRYDNFVRNLLKPDTEQLQALHAALGVAGEAGELADAIKKEYVYNKPRDRDNIVEELGDLRFYIQAVMNHYNITEQELLQFNANKLATRYVGLKYSDEAAHLRRDKSDGRTT